MPATTPTAEELKAKSEELAKMFLDSLTTILSSKENINEAVEYRAILIGDPSSGKNKDTLESVKHHFDEKGNRREGAEFYVLHNPGRAEIERKLLRPTDLSDREHIALVSALFKAGVDMLSTSHGIMYASQLGDAVRTTISQELRDVAGLKNPGNVEDYSPRTDFENKLKALSTNEFTELVNKVIANYTNIPKLFPKATQIAIEAKKYAEDHLEKPIQADPTSPKAEINRPKQKLLMRTNEALTEFRNTWNKDKLIVDMMEIKREDEARVGGKGLKTKTSDIINKAYKLATEGLSSREKLSLSQTLSHVGVFATGSKSPSPDASPGLRSPRSGSDVKSPSSDGSPSSPGSRTPK